MRTFKTGSGRFFEDVQIVGGPKTRATIQRANLTDNPQVEFAFPKISCRVPLDSLLVAGQVVRLKGDGYYLTADHSATDDYKILHLFRTDRQVVWARKIEQTDVLTGLPKSGGEPTPIATIYVMWERVRRQFTDTAAHFNAEQMLIATGSPVEINDFIDGKIVKRATTALGVRILELQA